METVVVIMSTYNGIEYLDVQIQSILDQKNVEVKLLVRDDGSADGTVDKLKTYMNSKDSVRLIEGENVGFSRSFTLLLKKAVKLYPEASWFAFADQDDYWQSDKLSRALSFIKDNVSGVESDTAIAYASNTTLVDKNLNVERLSWKPEEVALTPGRALVQNFATGCTMVFNREAAELYVRLVPESIRSHDFFMYQICSFLGRFVWDSESRILYRQHGHNQIGRLSFMQRMKRRFSKTTYLNRVLENQNRQLYGVISPYLDDKSRSLIEKFCNYRHNISSRISLLFDREISCSNRETDFFYRLKILLGTV